MKNTILLKVFAALFLAIIVGSIFPADAEVLGVPLVPLYGLIGKIFLNALSLVVVPLVGSSIIIGTARMGADSAFKRLGKQTFVCFAGTVFLSILVGYFLVQLIQPGSGLQSASMLENLDKSAFLSTQVQESGFQKIEQLLLRLVPTNILAAAAQGQMLGLIVFSMMFGFFLTKIESEASKTVLSFFQGVFLVMMKLTTLIMKALPVGVFFLIAKVVATTGLEAVSSVFAIFVVVLLGLAIEMFIVFPLLLKVVAKVNPLNHFRAMMPALMTAFSTSSSAATMPVTMECLEKNAGVSNRICGFTIPLGTSVNMPGSALHVCCCVFFIAQVYQFPLTWSMQGVALFMILLTSFGIAGVPSASLIAVVTVLSMLGLPSEGLALIFAVERLIDMCRTTVNVFGNSCCAVMIDSYDKQKAASKIDPVSVSV